MKRGIVRWLLWRLGVNAVLYDAPTHRTMAVGSDSRVMTAEAESRTMAVQS